MLFRSNTFKLGEGLETGKWYNFRFRPWDDFGPGQLSQVVSGYLEAAPNEDTRPIAKKYSLDGGKNQDDVTIDIPTSTLVKGYRYKIDTLGSINWTNIGADRATLNLEFVYNGTTITGANGKVKRVETKYVIPESQLNTVNAVDPKSDTSMVLPADISEGTAITIVNRGKIHNLHILDANGNEISIIRPNERAEIIRDETEWLDARGSILSLE